MPGVLRCRGQLPCAFSRHQPQAYIQRLAGLTEELNINCLIPTCEEIFYIAAGLEHITGCRVLAPCREILARLHHKGEFIDWVRSLGFAVPETTLIISAAEWHRTQEIAAADGKQQVYKPAFSRFASKVILPGSGDAAGSRSQKQRQIPLRPVFPLLHPGWHSSISRARQSVLTVSCMKAR